jgi:hypothetical protein
VYPASPVKSAAIVTMVVDQLTAYGLFVHPLCIMWEKLWKIHYKPDWFRLPARLPIGECCSTVHGSVYYVVQPVPVACCTTCATQPNPASFMTALVCWYHGTPLLAC